MSRQHVVQKKQKEKTLKRKRPKRKFVYCYVRAVLYSMFWKQTKTNLNVIKCNSASIKKS